MLNLKSVLPLLHGLAKHVAINGVIFMVLWYVASTLLIGAFDDRDFSILGGLFIATYFIRIAFAILRIPVQEKDEHENINHR